MPIPIARGVPIILLLLLSSVGASAQQWTISGNVTDLDTGENIIDASVVNLLTGHGCRTNEYGFFILTDSGDTVVLEVLHLGLVDLYAQIICVVSRTVIIHQLILVLRKKMNFHLFGI